MSSILDILKTGIRPERLFENEPMKNHTTFKIGGPTDILVAPGCVDEVMFAVQSCKDLAFPYFIMGNGSNLLVADDGFRGVVIKIAGNMKNAHILNNCEINAQSGALLSSLANIALEAGLTGLEFASGIPGTLGGAMIMNAGAYDGEIKNIFVSAEVLTDQGEIRTVYKDEMDFGYRRSRAGQEGWIVLSAVLRLESGDYNSIKDKMNDFNGRRRDKQPLELPSAGSTFKRPDGMYAGKLIMDSGLRGCTVGGAQVSEKHCGFVVNTGTATARDVMDLIIHIQSTVKSRFNVDLETEIKILT